MGFNGFMHSGFNVTHVDMSPEFSGTLMGLTNCIANLTGFLAPLYVGIITESGQTLENWRYVFVTTSIVFLVSGVIYDAFCTAELQPWGKSKSEDRRPSDDDRAPIIEDPS
ncbi:vesicular glutamate transporter 1 [Trichonephila clavipes]|nr:vesicular glutamate transporter 1 [Trichonephila clavipes]